MAGERQLVVQILGDASSAIKAFQGMQSSADSTASRMSQLGDRFTDVGKRATLFVTLPIVGALGAATKAAADEGKEMAVLANSLKNATGATADQVAATEKWITKTQNATGIADGELRPALGRLVMATKDTEKAQDLLGTAMDVSVARGISLETAATALSKAYLGNTAGLGRLGIATKDAEGNALTFEQVMANLNKTVGGAAAAAADTAAGRAAILRAKFSDLTEDIGTRLIPVMEKIAGVIGKVFDAFTSLPDGAQQFAVIAALAAAAVGPISSVIGMVLKLSAALKGISAAQAITGLGGFGAVSAGIAATAGAMLLAREAYDKYVVSARGAAKVADEDLANAFLKLSTRGVEAQEKYLKALGGERAERVIEILKATGHEAELVGIKASGAVAGTVDLADGIDDVGDSAEDGASAFDKVKEAVDAYTKALNESLGITLSANDAQRAHRENVDALAVAITENGTQVGFATEKQRALGAAVDAAVKSAQDEVAALTQDGKIAADNASQKASLILRLEELKGKYPQLAGAIQEHINKINSVPDEKGTTLNVDSSGARRELDSFMALLLRVSRAVTIAINPIAGLALPGRAHGGPVTAGHAYVVGETRPELFIPDSNGTVIPRVPSSTGSASSPTYVDNRSFTVNMPSYLGNLDDAVQSVKDRLLADERRNGPIFAGR